MNVAAAWCKISCAHKCEGVLLQNSLLFSQPSGFPCFVFILTKWAQKNQAELQGFGLVAVMQGGEGNTGWIQSSVSGWREMVGLWWVQVMVSVCLCACSSAETWCFCLGRCTLSREGWHECVFQHGVCGPFCK